MVQWQRLSAVGVGLWLLLGPLAGGLWAQYWPAIRLEVPAGARNGDIIKAKVTVTGGTTGLRFDTEGLQFVRGYYHWCGWHRHKPCLVNDQIQSCPSPPDGCGHWYCLSCSYDGNWKSHEISTYWYSGLTAEFKVNACAGPNPRQARIRVRYEGPNWEGPFLTAWQVISLSDPIVTDFEHLPAQPLCAGDPIFFRDTSCGGTDWKWNFGDGQTAEGKNVMHVFTDPGSYPVTLTVSADNYSASKTKTLELRGDCATIQGTITDSTDGSPLGGAAVRSFRVGWDKIGAALPNGQYQVRVPPNHLYQLVASYPGYHDSPAGSATPGPNETVTVNLSLLPRPADWIDPRLTELYNLGQQYDALADPVNPFTGSYYFNRTLFGFPGRGDADLAFDVSYNSLLADEDGPLGFGWTHGLHVRLSESGGVYTLHMPDGSRRFFTKSGTTYTPHNCYANGTLADRSPAGWSYTFPEQTQWLFDAQGRLERIANPRGHDITLTYDGGTGRLQRVTDASGRIIDFTWSGARLASIATPLGNPTVEFSYDGAGNLVGVRDARGNSWAFTYDAAHRLLTERDRRGVLVLTNTYDAQGRVATQTDAVGGVTTFAYTSLAGNRRRVVITPPSGNAVTHLYGANGQLLKVTDGEGHTASFGWDANGQLAAATDKLGQTMKFASDARGRPTSITDRLGDTFALSYTSQGWLQGVASGGTTTAALSYHGNGLLAGIDVLGHKGVLSLGYDNNLATRLEISGLGTWEFGYNAQGLRSSSKDPHGKVTTLTYDAAGRPTQLTLPDGLGSYQFSRDANGNLTSFTDPAGHQTTFTYDQENNLLTRTFVPTGASESLTYDAARRVTAHTDALGGVTRYEYDADSNLVKVTDPDGVAVQYAYDRRNLLKRITLPSGHWREFTRDANGNLVGTVDNLGRSSQMRYEAEGAVSEVRTPLGHLSRVVRTPDGQVIDLLAPTGEKVRLRLNEEGNPVEVRSGNGDSRSLTYLTTGEVMGLTDERGHGWSFGHDAAGRLVAATDPAGRTHSYAYDALDRVSKVTRPSGEEVSYQYNASGWPSRITLPGGAQVNLAYAYGPTGVTVTVTEAVGTTTLKYDRAWRLVERTDAQGNAVKFSYTPAGRTATVTYPGNRVLSYTYDGAGRLQRLTDWTGKVTTFTYDAVDRLVRMDFPNGTATTYAYDSDDQLTQLTHLGPGGTTLLSYALTRDAAGRVTALATTGALSPELADEVRERRVDPAHQLVFDRTAAETTLFTFDANGRQTARQRGTEVTTFSYDALGRLVGVQGGGHTTTYLRDFSGSCLRRVHDGVEVRYLRDGNRLWATLDAGNAPTRFFVEVSGVVLYTLDPAGGVQVLHADPQGSVAAVTDGSGAVAGRFAYDPFGRVVAAQGSSELGFLGAWGVLTDPNGLLHTGVRMYDPATRRFLTPDPLGPMAAATLYAYTAGDPVNAVDPSGFDGVPPLPVPGWRYDVVVPQQVPVNITPPYPTAQVPPGWSPEKFAAHMEWLFGEYAPHTPNPAARDVGALFPGEPVKVGNVYVTEGSMVELVEAQPSRIGWARHVQEVDHFRAYGDYYEAARTGRLRHYAPELQLKQGTVNLSEMRGWKTGYTTSRTPLASRLKQKAGAALQGGVRRLRSFAPRAVGAGGRVLATTNYVLNLAMLPYVGYTTARATSSELVWFYNEGTGRWESGDEVITNYFTPGQITAWAPPEDPMLEFKKRLHKIQKDFFAGLKRNAPAQ